MKAVRKLALLMLCGSSDAVSRSPAWTECVASVMFLLRSKIVLDPLMPLLLAALLLGVGASVAVRRFHDASAGFL